MSAENYFKIPPGRKILNCERLSFKSPIEKVKEVDYRTNSAPDVDNMKSTIYRLNKDISALMDENSALVKSLSKLQISYLRRERWLWHLKTSTWSLGLVYSYYYFIASGMLARIGG